MAPTGARRSEQATQTRDRLLAAARTAFATKGYDGTQLVADVLQPSGVSAGSFYHQFRAKADLYAAVVQEAAADWASPFDLTAAGDPGPVSIVDVVRQSYTGLFDLVDRNEDLVRIQHRDSDHPDPAVSGPLKALREGWVETLTATYQGLTPDPGAAAELIVALVIGAVTRYLDTPRYRKPQGRARLIDNLTTFTLGGFLALSQAPGSGR